MSSFLVVFGSDAASIAAWTPTADVPYECAEAEAQARYELLREAGLRGAKIDGLVPWYVAIWREEQGVAVRSCFIERGRVSEASTNAADFDDLEFGGHSVSLT